MWPVLVAAAAIILIVAVGSARADVMTVPMAEAQSEYREALHAEFIEDLIAWNGPYSHPVVAAAPHSHPTPTYGPGVTQWRSLVAAYFLPEHVDAALSVIKCESEGNPLAKNPHSTASGLFQFLKAWWSGEWALPAFDPFNPEANIAAAASVTGGGVDWGHWFASRRCHGL